MVAPAQAGLNRVRVSDRAWSLAFAVLVACLSAGCAPEYNWREVRPADGGYQVMFPGKPSSASREISLDGQRVSMQMTASEAGGHTFAVGVIALPEDSEAWRQRALAAMQAQLARNIAARRHSSTPIAVAISGPGGLARAQVPATLLDARVENASAPAASDPARGSAAMAARPNALVGGFVARGARAWQFVVIGVDPPADEVKTFVDSFRLIE